MGSQLWRVCQPKGGTKKKDQITLDPRMLLVREIGCRGTIVDKSIRDEFLEREVRAVTLPFVTKELPSAGQGEDPGT